jgi:hypothetical protein
MNRPVPAAPAHDNFPGRAIKVRCETPTVRGCCNRWQFRMSADAPDGVAFEFRCAHCKETTIAWSSQLTRQASNAVR